MSDGVTVDANIMGQFEQEYHSNVDGLARLLIEKITVTKGFVVDRGGKIEHEWLATCHGPFFKEWFVTQLQQGVVRYVSPKIEVKHKKGLHTKCGFPKGSYDLVYVAVANVTQTRYIVTGDIDFYDAALKKGEQQAKVRARDQRCGPVCRYLRKQMSIGVGTVAHAWQELF